MEFLSHLKWENVLKNILKKLEIKNDDVATDVAQCKRNNIKCYASAFSNI